MDWLTYKSHFKGFVIKGSELSAMWYKGVPIERAQEVLTKRGRKWQYAVKHRRHTIDRAMGDIKLAEALEPALVRLLEHRMPDDVREHYEELLRKTRVTIRGPENDKV